jgi:hypothetical protein
MKMFLYTQLRKLLRCCGSRAFIFDSESGFFPPRIPDPRSNNDNNNKKEEGKKEIVVFPFLVAINFTKLKFFSGRVKDMSQLTKNLGMFNLKNCS